jgi:hypothetical protein
MARQILQTGFDLGAGNGWGITNLGFTQNTASS